MARPNIVVPVRILSDSRAVSEGISAAVRPAGSREAGTSMLTTLASGRMRSATSANCESITENARHTSAPTSEPMNTSHTATLVPVRPNVRPHAVRRNATGMPIMAPSGMTKYGPAWGNASNTSDPAAMITAYT